MIGPDNQILDVQPTFFMGVCEARNDPLKLGRVKVRIFGLHTDDLDILSADDLPWASCLIPTTEAGPAGLGTTRSGIPPGTWVFGLFLDGEEKQQPLILGSIQGLSKKMEKSPDNYLEGEKRRTEKPLENEDLKFKEDIELGVDISRGFTDPHEEKLSGNPKYSYAVNEEPESHKLARSTNTEYTFEERKRLDRTFNIHKAIDRSEEPPSEVAWDEEASPRATEYPYLHIHESESGIVDEVDDTPYHERVQTYLSPSLSYDEVGHHHYTKTLGNRINIQHSPNHKSYILGNSDSYIGIDVTDLIGGNEVREVYGTSSKIVYGNFKLSCLGNESAQLFGSNLETTVGNDYHLNVINEFKIEVGSNSRIVYRGTLDEIHWMRDRVWNEGNVHRLRKRDLYEKINQKAHYIINDGRYTLISLGDEHLTIAKDYKLHVGADSKTKGELHEIVKGKKKVHIFEDVNSVYEQNEFKQVIKDMDLSVGGSVSDVVLENRQSKVVKDKILQVKEWFYKKISNALNHVGVWWMNVQELKQVIVKNDSYIKAKRSLTENRADHTKADHSLKVDGNYHVKVGGNLVFDVGGRVLIKAGADFVVGAQSESIIGCGGKLHVGGTACIIYDPPADEYHVDVPHATTVKSAIQIPQITANIIDLSSLASLTPPECPDFEIIQPDYPKEAEMPTKPTLSEEEYV